MNRLKKPIWTFATEAETEGGEQQEQKQGEQQSQAFTQADVDRIVADRLKREREATKAKYADYDDLKTKAGEKATLEDRVAEIEKQANAATVRALRAEIANAHGVSAEDRDLFLTGTDEETLTAQAKRLGERESERKKQGNRAPREGGNPKSSGSDEDREFVRNLFATAD